MKELRFDIRRDFPSSVGGERVCHLETIKLLKQRPLILEKGKIFQEGGRWFGEARIFLQPPDWSLVRGLLQGDGLQRVDLAKPLIGVGQLWNRSCRAIQPAAEFRIIVKQGIFQAGGTPVEFRGHRRLRRNRPGARRDAYILPTRGSYRQRRGKMMIGAHRLDAVVPSRLLDQDRARELLMAAARMDIPAILAPAVPWRRLASSTGGEADISALTKVWACWKTGKMTEAEYQNLENCAGPGCGSCSFFGTANTCAAWPRPLGLVSGSAAIRRPRRPPAGGPRPSGRRIVSMVMEGLTARKIITRKKH